MDCTYGGGNCQPEVTPPTTVAEVGVPRNLASTGTGSDVLAVVGAVLIVIGFLCLLAVVLRWNATR